MSKQPLLPLIDPTSTSSDVSGGALTNDLTAMFIGVNPFQDDMIIDQLIDMPWKIKTLTFSTTNTYDQNIDLFDPFDKQLYGAEDQTRPLPYAIVAIRCCYFYDFDIEITLWAIKHERSRGMYQLLWVPGLDDTAILDLSNVSKVQKWTWDIENTSSISVLLKGWKNFAWRDRTNRFQAPPDDSWFSNIGTPFIQKNYLGGQFQIRCLNPYNAGAVGPSDLSVIMLGRLVNFRSAEFRPPYALPYFGQSNIN